MNCDGDRQYCRLERLSRLVRSCLNQLNVQSRGTWRGIRKGPCPLQGRASVVIMECWKAGVNQGPCGLEHVGDASRAEGWMMACCGASKQGPECGGVQVRGQARVGAEHPALVFDPRQGHTRLVPVESQTPPPVHVLRSRLLEDWVSFRVANQAQVLHPQLVSAELARENESFERTSYRSANRRT